MSPHRILRLCTRRALRRFTQRSLIIYFAVLTASSHSGCATAQSIARCPGNSDELTPSCHGISADDNKDAALMAAMSYLQDDPDCEYEEDDLQPWQSDSDPSQRIASSVMTNKPPSGVALLMQDVADDEVDVGTSKDETCWHQQMRITQPKFAEERYLGPGYIEIACGALFQTYDDMRSTTKLSPLMQLAAVGWNLSPCKAVDRANAYLRAAQSAIAPVIGALWDLGTMDAKVDLGRAAPDVASRYLHVAQIARMVTSIVHSAPDHKRDEALSPLHIEPERAALTDWWVADQSHRCALNYLWSVPMGYVDGYMASCEVNSLPRQLQCRQDADRSVFHLVDLIHHQQATSTAPTSSDAAGAPPRHVKPLTR